MSNSKIIECFNQTYDSFVTKMPANGLFGVLINNIPTVINASIFEKDGNYYYNINNRTWDYDYNYGFGNDGLANPFSFNN